MAMGSQLQCMHHVLCRMATLQQPFNQTQLEHVQYKYEYTSQQLFLPIQLEHAQYNCKYTSQQPFLPTQLRCAVQLQVCFPAATVIESQLGHKQVRCK